MKHLYLLRHAKSNWDNPKLDDFDRPLNTKGKKDAPRVGKFLKKQELIPDVIISSPAKRAIETAEIIAKSVKYPFSKIIQDNNIYNAQMKTLLKTVRSINDKNEKAMLIGHNPGITDLANCLSSFQVENIPACGIVCLDFDADSWKSAGKDNGIFILFNFPEKLKK
ncbi:MAG: histidine phosphatase family protein [Candidatus Omnitrophica bacterium]|nr:histidine phosphatase family protein [Candidatus Omnitrophota bacterium]